MAQIATAIAVEKKKTGSFNAGMETHNDLGAVFASGTCDLHCVHGWSPVRLLRLSLYQGEGYNPTTFVGLTNYIDLFTNPSVAGAIFRRRLAHMHLLCHPHDRAK